MQSTATLLGREKLWEREEKEQRKEGREQVGEGEREGGHEKERSKDKRQKGRDKRTALAAAVIANLQLAQLWSFFLNAVSFYEVTSLHHN